MELTKAIIFDWGRTLHDPETDSLFEGVSELLKDLSSKYVLALVTLAKSEPPEVRKKKIEESGVSQYFKLILAGGDDKDEMYEQVLVDLALDPSEIAIVDDRTVRGIAWGNRKGLFTIWLQKGKFASELPSAETGMPSQMIQDIGDLRKIL